MVEFEKISKRVTMENRGRSHIRATALAALLSVLSFILIFIITSISIPEMRFIYSFAGFGAVLFLIFGGYLFLWLRFREGINDTAVFMDKQYSAKNRLETSLEIESTDNPLKEAQIQQSTDYYSTLKKPVWGSVILLMWILTLCFLSADCGLIAIQYQLRQKSLEELTFAQLAKKDNPKAEKNKMDKPEVPDPDYYELNLVSPEPTIRATPLDEIDWKGEVEATHGFKDLAIALYVNGEYKTDLPVDDFKKNTPDKIQIEGEFFLDELNVTPFDVVSYHLTGHAEIGNEKNKKVIGVPQFIEIRPFNEDAYHIHLNGGNGMDDEKKKLILNLLNITTKLLRFQLTLNKATYTIRASGLSYDSKILQEQLGILSKEQAQLKTELTKVLKETPPEAISANMMNYLRKTEEEMSRATTILHKLTQKKTGTTL